MEVEPNITAAVRSKASLVCFSGDKLFGSTQAGIILGDSESIERLHRNPMYRTFRLDKLSIAVLQETTLAYLKKNDLESLPLWRQISTPVQNLKSRATAIKNALARTSLQIEVTKSKSTPGGGSLPGGALDSVALAITTPIKANHYAKRLLVANPPLVGYIDSERFMIDLRTIDPSQDADVIRILSESA
jgi:L-seryl-tRNA(Ser) seleniumtransferase